MSRRYRDAISGQFVTKLTAKLRPADTVSETVAQPIVVTEAMVEAAVEAFPRHHWLGRDPFGPAVMGDDRRPAYEQQWRKNMRQAIDAALAARETV